MTAFCGQSGASSRHPCLLCSAVGPRWESDEQLVAFYGCLQNGSQCRGEPRTVEQATEVCRALGSCSENASLVRPMTHDQHRSIQRRPLMLVPASDIAFMPLHKTLSITTDLLHLAAKIVQASCVWRSGVPSWKGRGPSAVDSTPPGAVPKYPDPGQQGNDLSRSRGDWIWSGAGLFPSGFPNPPTTCLNFSLWRDLSVWRIWGGYFGHRRSGLGWVY